MNKRVLNTNQRDNNTTKLRNKITVIIPFSRGMLDLISAFPKFKIPKGKTLDNMIISAHEEALEACNTTVDFIDAVNVVTCGKANIFSGYSYDKGLDNFSSFKRLKP